MSLKLKLRAFKGHLTRAEKELQKVITFVSNNTSPRGLSELDIAFVKYRDAFKKVEDIINEILSVNTDDVFVTDCDTYLNNASTKMSDMRDQTLLTLNTASAPGRHNVDPRAPSDATPHKPKICNVLKPYQLHPEHTPADLGNWIAKFNVYHSASGMSMYTTEEQHMFLCSCISPSLEVKIREHDNYKKELPIFGDDSVIKIIQEEFDLYYPLFNRRLDFFQYKQTSGQKFSDFMLLLKQKGEVSDLQSLDIDSLYVFRFITGTTDPCIRERFLKLVDPTLHQLKQEVRSYEAGIQAARAMDERTQVSQIGVHDKDTSRHRNYDNRIKRKIPVEMKGKCWTCGSSNHGSKNCSKDKNSLTCFHCGKRGHMSIICIEKLLKNKKASCNEVSVSKARSGTHSPVDSADDSTDDECSYTVHCRGAKSSSSRPTPKCYLQFRTLDNKHSFGFSATPDTGATRSIVAHNIISQKGIHCKPTSCRLFTANGNEMSCSGRTKLGVNNHIINAIVSPDIHNEILISWHDLQALNIISGGFPNVVESKSVSSTNLTADDVIAKLKSDFPDVLNNSLKPRTVMSGSPMKIHLRNDIKIQPKRNLTARKIPLHFQKSADTCIKTLLKLGILQRVDTPTDWVSSGHFVPKPNGTVRLVTDYTNLNEFVQRPIHPFPTGLDIIQRLNSSSKWFAKLDAIFGYFQIPLGEKSSFLTTFLIPQGRFRYTRAPMGLNASGDEWCYRSDLVLEGLEGVHKLVDDILVEADTLEDLNDRLQNVLKRCRDKGIQLSLDKFDAGKKIKFAGHIISDKGTQPDDTRLEAIANFKSPDNVTELRSFLGLANQLGNFIPDLAHMTSEIRKLLKKNIIYQWLPEHENQFRKIKRLLTSDMLVKPYDKNLPTELLTDASRLHGLGFCLIQQEGENKIRLLSCGSCSLTPTQSRYATVELECLAVQWAIRKCDFWLRGIPHFKVITDHRPLVGIFHKPLNSIENPRLQRMRGKLAGFTFDVEWKSGRDHQIADALSRAPVWPGEDDDVDRVQIASIRDAIQLITVNNLELAFFTKHANTCKEYKQLITAIKDGKTPHNLPLNHIARSYSKIWEMLSLYEDDNHVLVLFDGHRIVVPKDIRSDILQMLHVSHQGLVKTRQLARRCYYWPGMNASIKNLIDGCRTCVEFLPSQPHEPFRDCVVPNTPMTNVGIDLFDALGKKYLVMVDRFSGYLFVSKVKNSSTSTVINVILKWFYDFGFPDALRSDGGPCFRAEFQEFCAQHYIKHELSSAYNPMSNGLAEAAVKNAKKLLLKCNETSKDFDQTLSEFRLTPRADGFSPADLMFGRSLRGLLPAIRKTIDTHAGHTARQRTLDISHLRHASQPHLSSLQVGDDVIMQEAKSGRWRREGKIVAVRGGSRSFEIQSDGKTFIRNRRFIRPLHLKEEL